MAARLDEIEVKGVKIPLIFEESRLIDALDVQIIFTNSGSNSDEIPGLAVLSAKLFNEGTKKLGSVKFAEELEQRAISIMANAGRETLAFEMSALSSECDKGLRFLYDILLDPNLTKDAFLKAKASVKASLLRKESDFDYTAQVGLKRQLFRGTPLENPSLGDYESLERISLKDIEAFWKSRIVLKRAIVLVGGSITLEEAKIKLAKLLAKLPIGELQIDTRYEASSDGGIFRVLKPTKQAYIYFGSPFNISNFGADSYKAKVAAFVLGSSGFGSRMMEEVRVKRGLAYSAYWRVMLDKSANSSFGYLQTKLENEEQSIAVVREVIAEFVKNGITEKELDGAKKYLLGSEPLRNETLSQRLGSAFNSYYRGLPLDFHREELRRIQELSLDEINAYIKEHKELLELTFSVVSAPKD